MAYKPTLEEIVRKLLDNATFYRNTIVLNRYDDSYVHGEELEEQLRAALYEIELQRLLDFED